MVCLLSGLAEVSALAQGGSYVAGGRSVALSEGAVTLGDAYALFHNPAALSQVESLTMLASYGYRPNWEGVQTAAVGAAGSWQGVGWGLGFWRYGDGLYAEQWLGAGIGYQMGLAAVGLKASWLQYHIEGFGTRHVPLLEAGGWAQITPQWEVGGTVTNLLLAKLSRSSAERVPTVMRLGLAYLPTPELRLLAEVAQPMVGNTGATLAVEYAVVPQLWLRAGSRITHRHFSGGLGYQWRSWVIDYATVSHYPAGWSHQLSIARQWSVSE